MAATSSSRVASEGLQNQQNQQNQQDIPNSCRTCRTGCPVAGSAGIDPNQLSQLDPQDLLKQLGQGTTPRAARTARGETGHGPLLRRTGRLRVQHLRRREDHLTAVRSVVAQLRGILLERPRRPVDLVLDTGDEGFVGQLAGCAEVFHLLAHVGQDRGTEVGRSSLERMSDPALDLGVPVACPPRASRRCADGQPAPKRPMKRKQHRRVTGVEVEQLLEPRRSSTRGVDRGAGPSHRTGVALPARPGAADRGAESVPVQRGRVDASSATSMGLVRKSSMPACRQRSRSPAIAEAVIAMTGSAVRRAPRAARIARVAS